MHIPDGFVSVPVAGATGLVSVAALFIALERSHFCGLGCCAYQFSAWEDYSVQN
ncbi:cobalamin biosynthesis protein CbiM [Nostoc commune NIES-4072]|uniref:Cobalamin biosynthesis protein CbiM n=1 Tax=Nostoc commune NIES-4072 TaxID=2005467 RepID=A0A2R5FN26_NOSCO|nr:cobalamin biosynthesis protein CbiM [Nostoc commune HK-02]GBG17191.1 cobalamin biosynthesis protein CbiM [Nostoc commune NIES-4072]